MHNIYKKIQYFFIILGLLLLSACGQTGPLYLPKSDTGYTHFGHPKKTNSQHSTHYITPNAKDVGEK